MFAAPVLMLLITLCTAVAGLFIFIQSGNHVYIESSDQYSRAEEILYHAVFHGKTDEAEIEDASGYRWLVQVLDPEQNYVLLRRADGTTVLQYGNSGLRSLFPNLPDPGTLREMEHPDKGVYARVENNEYCTLRKRTVGGTPYSCFSSAIRPRTARMTALSTSAAGPSFSSDWRFSPSSASPAGSWQTS